MIEFPFQRIKEKRLFLNEWNSAKIDNSTIFTEILALKTIYYLKQVKNSDFSMKNHLRRKTKCKYVGIKYIFTFHDILCITFNDIHKK